MQKKTILVVDDDPDITNLLNIYLSDEGYDVLMAHSAAEMWTAVECAPIDLVLLDLGLPDGAGFDLTRCLRSRTTSAIIIISRKNETIDQIVGLEIGADDYVVKPFDPRVLLARIRSVLRRCADAVATAINEPYKPADNTRELTFGPWRFDPQTYRLTSPESGETVLSANESALLHHMLENAGQVMSRDNLMVATTGRNWEYMDRSIDILVARLRKKIEADPGDPSTIKTVRGMGYVFSANVA